MNLVQKSIFLAPLENALFAYTRLIQLTMEPVQDHSPERRKITKLLLLVFLECLAFSRHLLFLTTTIH